jgi:hypothetical protein
LVGEEADRGVAARTKEWIEGGGLLKKGCFFSDRKPFVPEPMNASGVGMSS